MDVDDSTVQVGGRSRRQKIDKTGRTAALEKFRKLKGTKNKYEVDTVQEVWKELDEKEYSKLVRERQDDDWIIDDDGQGYVEDGREIFDDDDDESNTSKAKKRSEQQKNHGTANKNGSTKIGPSAIKSKNLKTMFMSMPQKRKAEKQVEIGNDDILNDIIHEMHNSPNTLRCEVKPTVLKKKVQTPLRQSPVVSNIRNNNAKVQTPLRQSPVISNIRNNNAKVQTPKRPISTKPIRPRLVDYKSQDEPTSMEQDESCLPDQESLTTKYNNEDCEYKRKFSDEEILNDTNTLNDIQALLEEDSKLEETGDISAKVADLNDTLEACISSNWDEMCLKYSTPVVKKPEIESLSTKSAALPTSSDFGETLKFFWFDAYEDYFKHPGIVYLFGKIWAEEQKSYISCCVTVRNIERTVYFLPREKCMNNGEKAEAVTFLDVYQELSGLFAEKYKIMQFRSKKTTKKYCFDKTDVPAEAEYLEAKYSAQYPALPSNLSGDTFSHAFGTNSSSLEQFLLDQQIKGPCWLEIKSPVASGAPISWCKIELTVEKPEHIVPLKIEMDIPPVTLMAFTIKTVVNPSNRQNEIVAFSCMIRTDYHLDKPSATPPFSDHFCAITKPTDSIFPFDFKKHIETQNRFKIMKFDSERAMLNYIVTKFLNYDPDVIVGHDIVNFDLGVLLNHLHSQKIPNWSRLGRLRKSIMPKFSAGMRISEITCGRLVCDVKIMAKEVIRSKSYDLSALTNLILKKTRVDLDALPTFSSSQGLLRLIEWSLLDVNFCLHIIYELNVLPLALQITNIAGNLMSRTVLGGRSERNEYLLLHAFTEKGYIIPDKQYGKQLNGKMNMNLTLEDGDEIDEMEGRGKAKSSNRRRKAAYSGGLVLEPKKGFYDKYILLMDFNSLYPSIIQEFNVCFTGVPRNFKSEDVFVPNPQNTLGILPLEISRLVESRKNVKRLLKNPSLSSDLKIQYDIRQKALKLTANSMYGCLGFANSRFYAKQLAEFITTKGREILLQTKNLVQADNLEVIYGDTDSIMINSNSTDLDTVMKLGNKIKQNVNQLYRHLEIEIDGVFKSMLLLKKKKYAALTIQTLPNGQTLTTEEIKGVDIVRRDWSGLACEAGQYVISQILSDKQRDNILDEIHMYLCNLKERILGDKVELEKWTITKQLTKNPEDYNDKKALPHVNVAIRLNSKGGKQLRHGDTVAYVICEDGSNLPATQRAYHLDELKTNKTLKIDKKYYLSQQVHPVISRLCDPIEGMDAVRIADALGLDGSAYRSSYQNTATQRDGGGEEDAMLGNLDTTSKDRFAGCEPLEFYCPSPTCKQKIVISSPFIGEGVEVQCALNRCLNPSCKTSPESYVELIQCHLIRSIRNRIQKYYLNWMVCDDPMCSTRTRKLPLRFEQNQPLCSVCRKGHLQLEYTESQLYNQLMFYQHIFDVSKASKTVLKPNERDAVRPEMTRLQSTYNQLKGVVKQYVNNNDYAVVNFSQMLDGFSMDRLSFSCNRISTKSET